ncbi:MAG TPA: pseudouridine synthase [Terracidiphilus sp.]|nr:pseudouridine synthase [Terracidiphilus sp.]
MTDDLNPETGEPELEPEESFADEIRMEDTAPDSAEDEADAPEGRSTLEIIAVEADFELPARPPARQERLQKILAQAGVASRRAAEEMIEQGRVQVNGKTVTEMGTKADPDQDHIRVDGKLLRGAERLRYFMLNKPRGYVTTVKDPEGRPTVMEFFARAGERLYPVGRLDYLSEGLLLVTNDGELANGLTRAASGVEKTYLVKVAGQPAEELLDRLREGVSIERGQVGEGKVRTAPARIRQVRQGDNPWYEVVLIEGRNRELRKMFEEIGHHVEKIRRVGYGPLVLDLEPGMTRELDPQEVEALRMTAAGKGKPKRMKSTPLLPTDAGLSAEQRGARAKGRAYKPPERKFDRKPKGGAAERPPRSGPRPSFSKPAGKFGGADRRPAQAKTFNKPWSEKPRSDRPEGSKSWAKKPEGDFAARPPRSGPLPSFSKPAGKFGGADRRPAQARTFSKPWSEKPRSDKPEGSKPWARKPEGGSAARPPRSGPRPSFSKPAGKLGGADRRPGQAKPFSKPRSEKPWAQKPEGGSAERPPRSGPRPSFSKPAGKFGKSAPGGKTGTGGRSKPAFGGKAGKPAFGSKPGGARPKTGGAGRGGPPRGGSRPAGPRPGGSRSGSPRPGGSRPGGSRPGGPRRPGSR